MTPEEKAKAYDKAIEKAKMSYHTGDYDKDTLEMLEIIFPELKESEDEKIRKELITHCRNTRCVTEEGAERIAKWIAWLEKQDKNKSAWSEEDKDHLIGITQTINGAIKHNVISKKTGDMQVDWLKTLKQRYIWKPSDEQLETLRNAIYFKPSENPSDNLLWGLYEQLKKL